jgi:hypothetical protein
MSIRKQLEAERLRGIQIAEAEEARARRRTWLLTALSIVCWPLLGIVIAGWGMHTANPIYGPVAVEAGILVANAGVLVSVLWVARRRE